jgi:hypothetical protein
MGIPHYSPMFQQHGVLHHFSVRYIILIQYSAQRARRRLHPQLLDRRLRLQMLHLRSQLLHVLDARFAHPAVAAAASGIQHLPADLVEPLLQARDLVADALEATLSLEHRSTAIPNASRKREFLLLASFQILSSIRRGCSPAGHRKAKNSILFSFYDYYQSLHFFAFMCKVKWIPTPQRAHRLDTAHKSC